MPRYGSTWRGRGVSRGTGRKHLDNVYAKLGVHTRTAAAAFVRGQQLLPETAVRGSSGVRPEYDALSR